MLNELKTAIIETSDIVTEEIYNAHKPLEKTYGKSNYNDELLKKVENLSLVIIEVIKNHYIGKYKLFFDELKAFVTNKKVVAFNNEIFFDERYVWFVNEDSLKYNKVIFEDDIAKHYETRSHDYNIKLYKAETVDILKMEMKVDKMLGKKISITLYNGSNAIYDRYQQDCFIPEKKVYNENGQFIGYAYKQVDIETGLTDSECIDLENTEKLTNLHILKGLIRLLNQIRILIDKGLTFTQNPYGHVFISKEHKKQVQLMNIELIDKNGNKEDTIRWTCEYVVKVISSDEKIFKNCNIKEWQKDNIYGLSYVIEKQTNRLTKYCNTHRMYYSGKYLFCPKCINIKSQKSIEVQYISKKDKKNIESNKKIGEGGEAIVYQYGDENVAKIFREGEIDYEFKTFIISKILEKSNVFKKINEENEKIEYVMPKELLIDYSNNKIIGYVMKKVKGLPLETLKDKSTLKNIGFTKKDIFEILIEVGKGIEMLHNNDIFIGDLNGKNIFFDTKKRVYFLDFDGMGYCGISSGMYTEGYIDPLSVKNKTITKEDDWYSFAIQAFYYLTGTHPFNGIYLKYAKNLDITEKMELKISLLGNHQMEAPAIAEPWDWMSEELKDAFLNIFEGDLRISMVPFLVRQYNKTYEGDGSFNTNSKFIPKE